MTNAPWCTLSTICALDAGETECVVTPCRSTLARTLTRVAGRTRDGSALPTNPSVDVGVVRAACRDLDQDFVGSRLATGISVCTCRTSGPRCPDNTATRIVVGRSGYVLIALWPHCPVASLISEATHDGFST
jgi:hypothetical protein